ncbi:MAG: DUF4301 family protein [Bacteroidales bacterium]
MNQLFNQSDLLQLNTHGISPDSAKTQLENFKKGYPFLQIKSPATIENNGIKVLTPQISKELIKTWDTYTHETHTILKFVPASGAATRMFKDLFEYLHQSDNRKENPIIEKLIGNIKAFAFYDRLNTILLSKSGKEIDKLISEEKYADIIDQLISKEGLNYGQLPKGTLLFHKYPQENRTPFEEHLCEGATYAAANGIANIHFTVSEEHQSLFEDLKSNYEKIYSDKYGVKLNITFSNQKKSTDTIAADLNNEPFRENGKLVFRPAGHGALIENLNDIDADIIFIKNIDNVSVENKFPVAVEYKKILAGKLIQLQQTVYEYQKYLSTNKIERDTMETIAMFLEDSFCINASEKIAKLENDEAISFLKNKLNRPIRVCGMIRNSGEPGGGPYIITNNKGETSLQILESSQIDIQNAVEKEKMLQSTHFNPVDLVCSIKNYSGEKYDLTKYTDPKTGFISEKTKNGISLKALEVPGLWNGAMSEWNTMFVEVPIESFNPVKTVIDLLREGHQY